MIVGGSGLVDRTEPQTTKQRMPMDSQKKQPAACPCCLYHLADGFRINLVIVIVYSKLQ